MKALSMLSAIFSPLLNLFGLGEKQAIRAVADKPYLSPQALRETHVYRGGGHSQGRNGLICPSCYTNTCRRNFCANRICPDYSVGSEAVTHPDLLSLDREIRLNAQARWAAGGMAALWGAN